MSQSVSIVTWNLNSIRPRLEHLLAFLEAHTPDIVLLQELKVEESAFPFEPLQDAGYNCAVWGQKTYNGVAILSRSPLEDVSQGLATAEGEEDDPQARYIEAVTSVQGLVLRVASVYVPNGQEVGSDKFSYKLAFLERLREHLRAVLTYEECLIVGGDTNVALLAQDVWDAAHLDGSVCYHPDERLGLQGVLNLGFTDAFRAIHPEGKAFSWWDYRGGCFERNHGLRIDHLLLSPEASDRLLACEIVEEERGRDKPSDHAPVLCRLQT